MQKVGPVPDQRAVHELSLAGLHPPLHDHSIGVYHQGKSLEHMPRETVQQCSQQRPVSGYRTGNGPYRENPCSKLVEAITLDQAAWAFLP